LARTFIFLLDLSAGSLGNHGRPWPVVGSVWANGTLTSEYAREDRRRPARRPRHSNAVRTL